MTDATRCGLWLTFRVAGKHATVRVAGAAITAVLEWARISEFRAEGSPVETVRRGLPKRKGGPKHHDAVHWSEVGSVLARIDAGQCMPSTKRAIRFTALTASRQVEVRRATWNQFDLKAGVSVKPAENTKTAKSHRVPLSRQALDVLADARKGNRGALLFAGTRPGAMMGNSVMTQALQHRRNRGAGPRVPVKFQGLGAAARRGRTPVGVRAGARRGLGHGGGLRARRPSGEAPPGHAEVGGLHLEIAAGRAAEVGCRPRVRLAAPTNPAPRQRAPEITVRMMQLACTHTTS